MPELNPVELDAPRELTQQEMELVSGGAADNTFFDSSGTFTGKETGSLVNGNGGSLFGGNGAVNFNEHSNVGKG